MNRTIYPAIKATLALPISLMVTALGTVGVTQQAQAFNLFGDRTIFQNQLDTFIVDDYSNPGYLTGDVINDPDFDILSNAQMSSVIGETQYVSTGFTDWNLIVGQPNNPQYCAGCNGSFLLDFTQTSVGSTFGVFGAAFDITVGTNYFAHVVFSDNSQQDFSLASVGTGFWGITSDQKIKSIHLGLLGGGTTQDGYITIDNLTIGSNVNPESVPEPSSVLGVLALGALGVATAHKRKKAQVS